MLAGVLLTRYYPLFKCAKGLHRKDYGDLMLALAVLICASITTNEIFFATAMLVMAWADGLAAVIGKKYGMSWSYKVFDKTKTVLGSMVFWFISLVILGGGLLWAYNYIDFSHYSLILFFLPPLLTVIENFSIAGIDNLTIPVAVLITLEWLQL
jgi:phytol kinase